MARIPRIISAIVLTCLLAPAWGDVVYMKDGTKHEGLATRRDGKVLIEKRLGTLSVDADDVLYISKSKVQPPVEVPRTDPNDAHRGASRDEPASGPTTPRPRPPEPFRLSDAHRPESIVFSLMRRLDAMPPGTESYRTRQRIDTWKRAVKDRKRRVDSQWYLPEDFIRRREAFFRNLREAEDSLKKAQRRSYRDEDSDSRREKLRNTGHRQLRQAARSWADPALRAFLSGVAHLRADDASGARPFFARAVELAPRVAAFHQGHGLALVGDDRPVEGLLAMIEALRLQPDSPVLLRQAWEAHEKVPGKELHNPAFVEADAWLKTFEEPSESRYSLRRASWALPGKDVRDDPESLPVPDYDRLVFRQAVGVPVADHALLVDRAVVEDAVEVFIEVDGRLVPTEARRSYYTRRRDGEQAPLTLLHAPACSFQAPVAGDPVPRKPGQAVRALWANVYAELGGDIRHTPGKVQAVDHADANVVRSVEVEIAPGSSAAAIVDAEGRLIGFHSGRTDALAEEGGASRFFPLESFSGMLERIRTYRRRDEREPLATDARAVMVHVTATETFGEMPGRRRY